MNKNIDFSGDVIKNLIFQQADLPTQLAYLAQNQEDNQEESFNIEIYKVNIIKNNELNQIFYVETCDIEDAMESFYKDLNKKKFLMLYGSETPDENEKQCYHFIKTDNINNIIVKFLKIKKERKNSNEKD
jgi:hypothetical protein